MGRAEVLPQLMPRSMYHIEEVVTVMTLVDDSDQSTIQFPVAAAAMNVFSMIVSLSAGAAAMTSSAALP